MLRKFAVLFVLGALSPLAGCQKDDATDVDTPVVTPDVDTDADLDTELDSDAALDDTNATTGN